MSSRVRVGAAAGLTAVALGASMFSSATLDPAYAEQADDEPTVYIAKGPNDPRARYGEIPAEALKHKGVRNKDNGWGAAQWPQCKTRPIDDLGTAVSRTGDRVVVRSALVPLVTELMDRTEAMGYQIKPGTTGGYSCRDIPGTGRASNHARGRALDINWTDNPMESPFKSDLPPEVVNMWERHGFYWGGRFEDVDPDPMHFEFYGTPESVPHYLAQLRQQPPPAPGAPAQPQPGGDPCKDSSALIRKGDRGAAVSDAQCLLARKGFPKVKTDGVFGRDTHKAVITFQRANGLQPDGAIGPETWARLKA